MHVLFVGFVWPEPRSSAASQNILSYVNACLAAKWQVSFCSAADTTTQSYDLQSINVNTFNANLNCSSFDEEVKKRQPDLVIFDRFLSFEQFAWRVKKSWPKAALVIDLEDLHCLRKARQSLYCEKFNSDRFMQSDDISSLEHRTILFNDISRREVACILQADLSIVLSYKERELLTSIYQVPEHQVVHLPFILSGDADIQSTPRTYNDKLGFMFIGNYRHAPNYHSVKILKEKCWPDIFKKLKRHHPEVSCHIYGAYSSSKVQQLENKSLRFFVHGFAPNQFEAISKARVMLAPIPFGAGVKGKLLDAMLCNTPSISTPIGAEGISKLSWSGNIADNVDEFIQQACNIYSDEDRWQQAIENANAILINDYNTKSNKQRFQNAMQACVDSITSNRQQNLLQQILDERQYQANKFMGQWIEAKNKK